MPLHPLTNFEIQMYYQNDVQLSLNLSLMVFIQKVVNLK